jgi:hypothetical protein
VPIDQNVNASAAEPQAVSAIENELPAYRAISPGAVFSLIFGTLAVFSFAHPFFLAFAVLAVVTGILTDRKIQRLSDVLTGRRLAQAGIALGLTFGLTSLTISTVQSVLLTRAAKGFARQYQDVLVKGEEEDYLWYGRHPAMRKDKKPKDFADELKKAGPEARAAEMTMAPYRSLKNAIAEPGSEFHFREIEGQGNDGTVSYAQALYELHRANPKPPEGPVSFALALLKGTKTGGKYEWWVENVVYPYKPASYVAPEKPIEESHGHAH